MASLPRKLKRTFVFSIVREVRSAVLVFLDVRSLGFTDCPAGNEFFAAGNSTLAANHSATGGLLSLCRDIRMPSVLTTVYLHRFQRKKKFVDGDY